MPKAEFIYEGDASKLVQEAAKIVGSQGKVEGAFKKTTAEGTRGMRTLEQQIKQLQRTQEQAARQTVAQARFATGSGTSLALTGSQRQLLASAGMAAASGTDVRALQDIAIQRRFLAQGLREQRATASLARRSAVTGAANLSGLDRVLSMGRGIGDRADARLQGRYELDAELAGLRYEAAQQAKQRWASRRESLSRAAIGIGAAVSGVAIAAEQELDRYAGVVSNVEDVMAPLYGVGGNMRRRGALRRDVMAQSVGAGVPFEQIAGMKFNLQSSASDLPAAVSSAIEAEAIKFYRLQRTPLNETARSLVAALQIVRDEIAPGAAGVQQYASKLGVAADIGAFNIEEFVPYQAMILGGFKGMGFSANEALGASALASKSGQRPEAWATAVRNIALQMPEARKKLAAQGVNLPRDFGGAMRALGGLPGEQIVDLFGRDPFVALQILRSNPDALASFTRQIGGQGPGADFVGAKLAAGWSDPTAPLASTISSARIGQQNAPARIAEMPGLGATLADWEVRKLGAEMEIHPAFGWFKGPARWVDWATGDRRRGGGLLGAGARQLINDAEAAGDFRKAGELRLRYGEQVGTYYSTPEGKRYTGAGDADEYRKLIGEGYVDLTGGEFLEFKRLGSAGVGGAGAAAAYLKRVGGYVDPATSGSSTAGAPVLKRFQQALMDAASVAGELDSAMSGGGAAPGSSGGVGLQ